jgi:hypothetical protein
MIGVRLRKLPLWSDPVLQGLSYWIGYKKQYFDTHPLSEGAIVSETLALIQSNLDKQFQLTCEIPYKKLGMTIDNDSRADIVIMEDSRPKYVIEVKKAEAGKSVIDNDLKRLSELKLQLPEVVCYLLLVSQNSKPKRFVNDQGRANEKKTTIEKVKFKTRRVCKAVNSFNNERAKTSAHYACLIEIEPHLQ